MEGVGGPSPAVTTPDSNTTASHWPSLGQVAKVAGAAMVAANPVLWPLGLTAAGASYIRDRFDTQPKGGAAADSGNTPQGAIESAPATGLQRPDAELAGMSVRQNKGPASTPPSTPPSAEPADHDGAEPAAPAAQGAATDASGEADAPSKKAAPARTQPRASQAATGGQAARSQATQAKPTSQQSSAAPPSANPQSANQPPAKEEEATGFAGAVKRLGQMFEGTLENPMVTGAAAIGTSILAYANLPIIGTIVSGIYCLGHLCKFLGQVMTGKLDGSSLRELGGALLTGAAAVTSAVCPALGMVNGAALALDMGWGMIAGDRKKQKDEDERKPSSFTPPPAQPWTPRPAG